MVFKGHPKSSGPAHILQHPAQLAPPLQDGVRSALSDTSQELWSSEVRTEGFGGSAEAGWSGLTADVFERHADSTCTGLAVRSGFVCTRFSKLSSVVNGCS